MLNMQNIKRQNDETSIDTALTREGATGDVITTQRL